VLTVLRNENGTFVDFGLSLPQLWNGDVAFMDYDMDGKFDLFITGENAESEKHSFLFHDIASGLNPLSFSFEPITEGEIAWFDADNDGDPDLLITGSNRDAEPVTVLYYNREGVFEQNNVFFENLSRSNIVIADFNSDSYRDVVIFGADINNSKQARYYENNKGDFALKSAALDGFTYGDAVVLDWNSDGKTDLMYMGINQSNVLIQKFFENTGSSFQ